jgi:hypothetical protein
MSCGYLVMAQGKEYLDMAIALAKSIKETQSVINSVAVITDQDTEDTQIFDHVIKLDTDLSGDAEWKIHNRCQFYNLSPFDETVILDADMLFIDDVSSWWNYMSKFDFLFTDKVKTYRDEWVKLNPYRKTFVNNQLPNVYSAFTYFKKSELAKQVFDLTTHIITNWNEFVDRFAPESKQDFASLDLAISLAVDILDVKDQCISQTDFPTFTHMKAGCQGWKYFNEDWKTHLGIYKGSNGVRIGNHVQSGILHYVDKEFLQRLA